MKAGITISSTALLDGTLFEQTTIFITEYNEKGAMGFVVNKPFGRNLNQLEAFKNGIAFPFYDGGPVDKEHVFFIHQRPDLITGGTPVADGIYQGGDFKQAVALLNSKTITGKDIKLFIGYCGWEEGELEEEVEEGSWEVLPSPASPF